MKCSYCGVELEDREYTNKIRSETFCDICFDKIDRMSPEKEPEYKKYYELEDGTVHYY